MKKESFFVALRKGSWEKTVGYSFTILGLPDVVWFVYGELNWWSVSEKSTGLRTKTWGLETRKAAIEHATKTLNEINRDLLKHGIQYSEKVPQELWDSLCD